MVLFSMPKNINIFIFVFLFFSACASPLFNEKKVEQDEITIEENSLNIISVEEKIEDKDSNDQIAKNVKNHVEKKELLIKREDKKTENKTLPPDIIAYEKETKLDDLDSKILDKSLSGKLIKIGLLIPLSGSAKEIGTSIYNASEMAIFELGSKNIILLPRDSGDNIETAVLAAKNLEKEGIAILVGPLFSFQAKPVRDIIDSNIPIFSFTNDESITKNGIWSFGFSPQQQIKAVIKEIQKNLINDIALIIPNTAYGEAAINTITKQQTKTNIRVKKIFRYFPESNDFSHLNKSSSLGKNIDFEALLILASGRQLREIASRVQYIGVNPKKVKFFGLSGWNSTNIFGEPSLLGGYFVAPDQTAYEAFVSRYHKIYGNWPSEVSALGYDILALSSLIIEVANKQTEIISLATSSDGFKGLFGYFKLGNNGKIYRKYVSYKVMDRSFLKQGEITPDYD